jgi:predicted nucleic acid-binding protein
MVRHGNRRGLRTLDALQLAVALDVQSRAGLDAFVVADAAFAEIADAQGVPVTNPEAT